MDKISRMCVFVSKGLNLFELSFLLISNLLKMNNRYI